MHIMVVDDDEALVKSLGIHLRQMGHSVTPCRNPWKALHRLQDGETPAVIIVDLVMPGMSGERFIREARRVVGGRCCMVLISGHTDVVDERRLKSLSVKAFLPKPLDVERLAAILDKETAAAEFPERNGVGSPTLPGEGHG